MNHITGLDTKTIDILYEERGPVDCDSLTTVNAHSWAKQGKDNAIIGAERRAYRDAQIAQANEELL